MISSSFSFVTSFFVVLYFIKYGYNVSPSERCAHKNPTPTSGGVAIVCGVLVGLILEKNHCVPFSILKFYGLAVVLLCLTGWLDDRFDISYRFRLLIHLICALMIMSSGVILVATWPCDIWWQKAITVFILMSLINAANFIDGINGLLCGCSLLCLITQAFLNPLIMPFVSIVIAASIPFFILNIANGKIFLGDAGSTFFGLTLGFIALMSPIMAPSDYGTAFVHKKFILSLAPMAFLWFDVVFTLFQRILRQKKIHQAHREHFIHILHDQGFSHLQITSFYASSVIVLSFLVILYHQQMVSFSTIFAIYTILQIIFLQWVWRLRTFT